MSFPGITWVKAPAPEAETDTADLQRTVAEVLAQPGQQVEAGAALIALAEE